ncbi:MAG: hypothetical protein AAFP76_06560 [Bacteroidota bacterium]
MKWFTYILSCTVILCVTSCKETEKDTKPTEAISKTEQNDCIEQIFDQDSMYGASRNIRCMELSLSQTITQYVSEIRSMNFEACPKSFDDAFESHALAWLDIRSVTDKYPELRGEMHDLFDLIEKTEDSLIFKKKLKSIWDTWAEVEKASGMGE